MKYFLFVALLAFSSCESWEEGEARKDKERAAEQRKQEIAPFGGDSILIASYDSIQSSYQKASEVQARQEQAFNDSFQHVWTLNREVAKCWLLYPIVEKQKNNSPAHMAAFNSLVTTIAADSVFIKAFYHSPTYLRKENHWRKAPGGRWQPFED